MLFVASCTDWQLSAAANASVVHLNWSSVAGSVVLLLAPQMAACCWAPLAEPEHERMDSVLDCILGASTVFAVLSPSEWTAGSVNAPSFRFRKIGGRVSHMRCFTMFFKLHSWPPAGTARVYSHV